MRAALDIEPGNTTAQCYGVALDIGTTTMAASLLDLQQGHELAVTSQLNAQVSLGDDVLSRIKHASEGTQGLQELATKGVMPSLPTDKWDREFEYIRNNSSSLPPVMDEMSNGTCSRFPRKLVVRSTSLRAISGRALCTKR